jgi:hypothetical protein
MQEMMARYAGIPVPGTGPVGSPWVRPPDSIWPPFYPFEFAVDIIGAEQRVQRVDDDLVFNIDFAVDASLSGPNPVGTVAVAVPLATATSGLPVHHADAIEVGGGPHPVEITNHRFSWGTHPANQYNVLVFTVTIDGNFFTGTQFNLTTSLSLVP